MSTTKKSTAASKTEAAKAAEAVVSTGQETVEAVVKASSDAAAKQVEKAVEITKAQVEKTSTAVFKGYDEMTALNKETMDAFVQSSTIAAKGFETVGKEWMAFTQAAVEANIANAKALMGVRNVKEALDLQGEYVRETFDKTLAEGTKLTELSLKVSNDAIKPLQDQAEKAVQKMMKPVAA